MTRSTFADLAPSIAAITVDPANEEPFFQLSDDDLLLVDRSFFPNWAAGVVNANCKTNTRTRARAGAVAYFYEHSMAVGRALADDGFAAARARALGLDRDLANPNSPLWGKIVARKWASGGHHYADEVALKIIVAVRHGGVPPLRLRRAINSVMEYHRYHRRIPPVIAVKALGCVVGTIDAHTGQIVADAKPLTRVLGTHFDRIRQVSALDFEADAAGGARPQPHELGRILRAPALTRYRLAALRNSYGYRLAMRNRILRARHDGQWPHVEGDQFGRLDEPVMDEGGSALPINVDYASHHGTPPTVSAIHASASQP